MRTMVIADNREFVAKTDRRLVLWTNFDSTTPIPSKLTPTWPTSDDGWYHKQQEHNRSRGYYLLRL